MNIVDILKLVGKSEDTGDVAVTLMLKRACSARRAVIVPGLLADVVRWGNREHPSMVFLRNTAVRDWAARSKHAAFRTWARSTDKSARDQAVILLENTFGATAPSGA